MPAHKGATHLEAMQHVISCHESIRRESIDPSQHIEFDIRQLLEVRADSLAVRNRFPAKLSAPSCDDLLTDCPAG